MPKHKLKPNLELEKARMKRVITQLKKNYPNATCSLYFHSPFQLLVATVLSAQCTDEKVNQVTPVLFKKFPTPEKMAKADHEIVEKIVYSTGFYRNKAKSLISLSQNLLKKFNGEVPREIGKLTSLSGVGRKTANVVLGNAFQLQEGIVVDTHVGRITRRLGFTKNKDPLKVEKDLVAVVPQKEWTLFSHLLINHGRKECPSRRPKCDICCIKKDCPKVI